MCSLNENDPTTKLLNKLEVNYDNVKEQFKNMITSSDDDFIDAPKAESFSEEETNEENEKIRYFWSN